MDQGCERRYRRLMRFQARRGKRAIAIDLTVVAVALAVAIQALVSGSLSDAMLPIAFAVLYLAGLALTTRFYGVTFTTDAVVIQGVRRRTIPRTAVSAVSTQQWYGADHIVLSVPHDSIRLPAPTSGPFTSDATFDAKARAIKDWAASGRLEAF